MSNRKLNFFRVGLPFFSIIFGGAFGLHYFQQVRFDFRKIKQLDSNLEQLRSDLKESGFNIREGITVESVYKEVSCIDTDNWENIRGPRESEDNSEYLEINGASSLDIGNPPEPDNASIRAERGLKTCYFFVIWLREYDYSYKQAVTWIIERSNLSDFEDSSESEDNEEMGAVNSTGELQNVQPLRTGVERMAFPQALVHRGRTHKMVLVVNTSLKMGTGKMAAQVGHATLGVYRQAMGSEMGQEAVSAWIRHGQVKIVVKGQSTEQLMDMYKTAKDTGCFCYLVQDAGYTQIPPGSRTILGVFGTVEQVDAVTGGLKLL
uniref:peptidyl-tRNA hydrolase n=1 Tax=Heterorhabditis bacteriophora TaxID=37862 RepID=A0A1I7XJC4_HETBA